LVQPDVLPLDTQTLFSELLGRLKARNLEIEQSPISMQGVAPVKLGEYLLCGLPVIASNGIGDSAIIAQDAGFLLDFPDEKALQMAADWFVGVVLSRRENFRIQSRATGKDHFSLEASVASYASALGRIPR